MYRVILFCALFMLSFAFSYPAAAQTETCNLPDLQVAYHLGRRNFSLRLDGSPSQALAIEGYTSNLSFSPSGTWLSLLENASVNQDGYFDLHLINIETNEVTSIIEQSDTRPVMAWSPVNDSLAYAQRYRGKVEVWLHHLGEEPELLDYWDGQTLPSLNWLPDGTGFIYYRSETSHLNFARTDATIHSVFADSLSLYNPLQWLDDNSLLMWRDTAQVDSLMRINFNNGNTEILLETPSFSPSSFFTGDNWLAYGNNNYVIVLDRDTGEFLWNIYDSRGGRFRVLDAEGDNLLLFRTYSVDSPMGDLYLANVANQSIELLLEDIETQNANFSQWLNDEQILLLTEESQLSAYSIETGLSVLLNETGIRREFRPTFIEERYLVYVSEFNWVYLYDLETAETCSVARTRTLDAWQMLPEDSQ